MINNNVFETEFGGRKLIVESGKYAMQTNGTCVVKCGHTHVMVNVTSGKEPREGADFFPLSVEFEEKMYSVGKIPGGFLKREGRHSEQAVLSCRLIDRPIRPLFPKGFYNEVQVVATVLSAEHDIPPIVYALIGSSVALSISDLPVMGPTGTVSVGMVDGEYIINPNLEQREASVLDLTVSGTKEAVMMVEAGAKEVSEEVMLSAFFWLTKRLKKWLRLSKKFKQKSGNPKWNQWFTSRMQRLKLRLWNLLRIKWLGAWTRLIETNVSCVKTKLKKKPLSTLKRNMKVVPTTLATSFME